MSIDEKYIVRDGHVFLLEKLDNLVKIESRYVEVSTKWRKLRSDLLSKIDDIMRLNQDANIAIPTNNDCYHVWYREPNQNNLFSANLFLDNAKNWLGRDTIFFEKESPLTKLHEKELRFGSRIDVFQSALSAAITLFINKSHNYNSLNKEYIQTRKVPEALMALNNKLVVLNFSGREYWYKYSMEYRTRGGDQFPRLYKICWSDNVPTRFTFGENK